MSIAPNGVPDSRRQVIRSAIKLLNMSTAKKQQHIAKARRSAQSRLHGQHRSGQDRPLRASTVGRESQGDTVFLTWASFGTVSHAFCQP